MIAKDCCQFWFGAKKAVKEKEKSLCCLCRLGVGTEKQNWVG